jgi:hypothetical protein
MIESILVDEDIPFKGKNADTHPDFAARSPDKQTTNPIPIPIHLLQGTT